MKDNWAIKVEDLGKQYHLYKSAWGRLRDVLSVGSKVPHETIWALKDINVTVAKGESLAILGLNGSGKSTLLKIISGVTPPTTGRVSVRGDVAPILELGTGFIPDFTGRENVYFSGYVHGQTREQIDANIASIEEFADIGGFIDQPVKAYSSGMYSRLAISVAFHLPANILIIDEVLAVGDVFFRQKCFDHLTVHLKERTKLFVTHNLELVSAFADRVLVLHKGATLFHGDTLEGLRCFQGLDSGTEVPASELADAQERRRHRVRSAATFDHANAISLEPVQLIGIGDILIEKVAIQVDGQPARAVFKGCEVAIDVLTRCKKEFSGFLIFGYSFRDEKGIQILSSDTQISGYTLPRTEAGRYVVRMEFPWPDLKPGDYTLTLGIAESGKTGVRSRQCWATDFVALKALKTNQVYGILNEPITHFEINQVAEDDGPGEARSEPAEGDAR